MDIPYDSNISADLQNKLLKQMCRNEYEQRIDHENFVRKEMEKNTNTNKLEITIKHEHVFKTEPKTEKIPKSLKEKKIDPATFSVPVVRPKYTKQ